MNLMYYINKLYNCIYMQHKLKKVSFSEDNYTMCITPLVQMIANDEIVFYSNSIEMEENYQCFLECAKQELWWTRYDYDTAVQNSLIECTKYTQLYPGMKMRDALKAIYQDEQIFNYDIFI